MQPVIILLNGPRRSGKDTAAEAMTATRPFWQIERVGPKGVDALQAFGVDPALVDIYETAKDEPLDELAGLSYRQVVIDYGNMMREQHGQDCFSKEWTARVKTFFDLDIAGAVIMPNCRFEHEMNAALAVTKNVLLYRLYRTAALHNDPDAWTGDIGSWLFPLVHDVPQIALINDSTLDDLRFFARTTSHRFFQRFNAPSPV